MGCDFSLASVFPIFLIFRWKKKKWTESPPMLIGRRSEIPPRLPPQEHAKRQRNRKKRLLLCPAGNNATTASSKTPRDHPCNHHASLQASAVHQRAIGIINDTYVFETILSKLRKCACFCVQLVCAGCCRWVHTTTSYTLRNMYVGTWYYYCYSNIPL